VGAGGSLTRSGNDESAIGRQHAPVEPETRRRPPHPGHSGSGIHPGRSVRDRGSRTAG